MGKINIINISKEKKQLFVITLMICLLILSLGKGVESVFELKNVLKNTDLNFLRALFLCLIIAWGGTYPQYAKIRDKIQELDTIRTTICDYKRNQGFENFNFVSVMDCFAQTITYLVPIFVVFAYGFFLRYSDNLIPAEQKIYETMGSIIIFFVCSLLCLYLMYGYKRDVVIICKLKQITLKRREELKKYYNFYDREYMKNIILKYMKICFKNAGVKSWIIIILIIEFVVISGIENIKKYDVIQESSLYLVSEMLTLEWENNLETDINKSSLKPVNLILKNIDKEEVVKIEFDSTVLDQWLNELKKLNPNYLREDLRSDNDFIFTDLYQLKGMKNYIQVSIPSNYTVCLSEILKWYVINECENEVYLEPIKIKVYCKDVTGELNEYIFEIDNIVSDGKFSFVIDENENTHCVFENEIKVERKL